MKKVYFIGGLAADKRVFSLLDLTFCDPVFLDWIPHIKHESLQKYSLRMRMQIPELNPTIIGLSFGGMLVTEMAKADKNIRGIIIASNKVKSEFPGRLQLGNYFPVYKWMPAPILKKFMIMNKWVLCNPRPGHHDLLGQIIKDSDIPFAKWAIGAILQWNNKEVPANIVHIHGTADKVLPYSRVKADYTIEGGSHVLTMDNPVELASILKKLIL